MAIKYVDYQKRWNSDGASPWRRWTHWKPLSEAQPPPAPGAYVVGLRLGGGRQLVVPRLLGNDEQGALDIGESGDLLARITSLQGCASGRHARGHMAGWRYRYLRLADKLPVGDLVVAWRLGQDSYLLEAETMVAYVNAFGELPPLNYKANWKLVKEVGGYLAVTRDSITT